MVNAKVQKDKILIRWAVNSPEEWQKVNKKGFVVTRTTVLRDGNVLPKPEKIFLTQKPLIPEPLDSWIDLVQKDNSLKRCYYIDTLSVNDKIYQYRLYGISSFGERGSDALLQTPINIELHKLL